VITIRHKQTGDVLLEYPGDTLAGGSLIHAVLLGADLRNADLGGASLR